MQSFIFNSPSVKINENNNTIPTVSNIPVLTPTGIVGEFPKGPAFEKILIKDKTSFISKFGSISSEKLNNQPKYLGNYYGLSYLEEGNSLYVTRVLGLSGYDAGDVYLLTLEQPSGITIDTNNILRTTSTLINASIFYTFYLSSSTLNVNNINYPNISSAVTNVNTLYNINPPLSSYTQNIINNKYYSTGTSFNFISSNLLTNGTLNLTASTNTLVNNYNITYKTDSSITNASVFVNKNSNEVYISWYSANLVISYLYFNNAIINNNSNLNYGTVNKYATVNINGTLNSGISANSLSLNYNQVTADTNSFVNHSDSFIIPNTTITFSYDYVINLNIKNPNSTFTLINNSAVTQTLLTTNVISSGVTYSYDPDITAFYLPTLNTVLSIPTISSAFTYTPFGYDNINTYTNLGDSKIKYNFNNLSNLTANIIQGYLGLYNYLYEAGFIYTSFINQIMATLRGSRRYVSDSLINQITNISFSVDNSSDPLSMFTITVYSNNGSNGNKTYRATLDPTSSDFISKVLPREITSGFDIYLENLYNNLLTYNLDNNIFLNKAPSLTKIDTKVNNKQYSNYLSTYQTPETPYIVSNIVGDNIKRLFKFVSISDGEMANSEIKISISNINFTNYSFTILIRDFNDTDNSVIILEQYDNCNLDSTSNNYVLKKIGGVFESDLSSLVFDINSSYVYLVLCDDLFIDLLPSGFEGYDIRNYSNILSPTLLYKNSYLNTDVINKTYLGINKIDLDLMKYIGNIQNQNTISKSKGFHLDKNVNTTLFTTGNDNFNYIDVQNINNIYNNLNTRKFTLALAGGFDGWDIFRTSRSNTDKFKNIENSDYHAYLTGIQTFVDTEDYHIDLLSTPNINFSDNTSLVQETISLVENRSDCFYVIDAPYLSNSTNIANQAIGLLETTDIDTSYASTYFGYIGITEPNTNKNLFIPPTGEVLRIMTLTDKITKPWFAPAGTNRGLIYNSSNLIKNFNLTERDSLQLGRINPIISTENYGINVFGQRTLLNGTTNNLLTKINVRRLLNYIKKEIKDIALISLFEQNNQTNVNNFLNKTKILLSNIQKQQGLNKYDLTVDNDNNTPENIDRGLMFFILNLYPISATEGIGINFTINPSDNIITFTNS